jgi:D-cysteine desulfhydrase family pyridoxal phosphate-dependent enzyme
MLTPTELAGRLADFPRVKLAHLPTPLEKLEGLTAALGSCEVWIKRDDATGLAFGGNKTRKLDWIMADARAQGADTIVTWAGVQSNWCRQTAAAAARLGMECSLLLIDRPGHHAEDDGNLLLDRMFGARISIIEAPADVKMLELDAVHDLLAPLIAEEEAAGKQVYLAPIGGSLLEGSMQQPWGAIGYVNAVLEIVEQAAEHDLTFDAIVHATGSGSTQAGLVAGAMVLAPGTPVIGISVSASREDMLGYIRPIAEATLTLLGLDGDLSSDDLIVYDEYLEEGYGLYTAAVARAMARTAAADGLLLDPVYTGKAMSGLLDLIERGHFRPGARILFMHTGGTPALFPYRGEIMEHLP